MDYILEGLLKAIELLASGHPETYSAIWGTVAASSLSIIMSLVLGAPLGFILGHYSFPGKRAVRSFTDTMLCMPTVVIGLLVYAMLTRHGPLGAQGCSSPFPALPSDKRFSACPSSLP